MKPLNARSILPEDGTAGTLVGRVWLPQAAGPAVVAMRGDGVFDVTSAFPTVSVVAELQNPAAALREVAGTRLGALDDIVANTAPDTRDANKPWLLAPLDLQLLKAAGVTFVVSMLERVIEERARGNPSSATAIRKEVERLVGDDLSKLKPGSADAMHLKEVLISQQAWSQYLEVGIGPMPRCSPRRRCSHLSAPAWTQACIRNRPGTIPSRKWCWWSRAGAGSSAPRLATTSTCATSRAARRCCSRRPRTTTRPARSARSCGWST